MQAVRDKIANLVREYFGLRREVVLSLLADPGTIFTVEEEIDAMLRDGSLVEKNGEYHVKDHLRLGK